MPLNVVFLLNHLPKTPVEMLYNMKCRSVKSNLKNKLWEKSKNVILLFPEACLFFSFSSDLLGWPEYCFRCQNELSYVIMSINISIGHLQMRELSFEERFCSTYTSVCVFARLESYCSFSSSQQKYSPWWYLTVHKNQYISPLPTPGSQ